MLLKMLSNSKVKSTKVKLKRLRMHFFASIIIFGFLTSCLPKRIQVALPQKILVNCKGIAKRKFEAIREADDGMIIVDPVSLELHLIDIHFCLDAFLGMDKIRN